jgi:hypothetical protein
MTKRRKLLIIGGYVLVAAVGATAGQIVGLQRLPVVDWQGYTTSPGNPSTSFGRMYYNPSTKLMICLNSDGTSCLASGGGGSGTVTSIATTSPITGGPITTTGTIACATCVVATSPGVGIAHFAGSTQTVTSSAVNLASADVTGQLPIGAVGSSGLSGTSPIAISAAGAISCTTCIVTAGANTALSNLAAVAINAALLPGTTNSIALGSSGDVWTNLFSTALNCGIIGTTSCVITGNGGTSGSGTITWPAVAGTSTNPIVFSNVISGPVGSATSPTFQLNGTGNGLFLPFTNQIALAASGVATLRLVGQGQGILSSSLTFGWANGADADAGTYDTGFCRVSAGLITTNIVGGTCTPAGSFETAAYKTASNCQSAGGTCGSAAAGQVTIAASASTVTVATTAVTASSEIFVQEDQTLGTALSVTCNTGTVRTYYVTTRTAATSFVITASAAPLTNPACLTYHIIN